MDASVAVDIRAPRKVVWDIVTNIADAQKTIKAIEKVEILERPPGGGLVGLKWRETRTMFGKEATEVMWITRAEETSFYETRAESHGAVYTTRIALDEAAGGTRLSMEFRGEPQTTGAKVMGTLFGLFMKGAVRKALLKDLEEIKAAAESRLG